MKNMIYIKTFSVPGIYQCVIKIFPKWLLEMILSNNPLLLHGKACTRAVVMHQSSLMSVFDQEVINKN